MVPHLWNATRRSKVLINQERIVREIERMQLKCYISSSPSSGPENPRYEFIDDYDECTNAALELMELI
jgi:hypothetical protein